VCVCARINASVMVVACCVSSSSLQKGTARSAAQSIFTARFMLSRLLFFSPAARVCMTAI